MSCKITKALAPNGQPSQVFNNISKIYMAEVGLVAQLHIYSDAFKDKFGDWEKGGVEVDENGEPNWRVVLKDVDDNYNISDLMAKSLGIQNRKGENKVYTTKEGDKKYDEVSKFILDNGIPATVHIALVEGGSEIVIKADVVADGFQSPNKKNRRSMEDDSDTNNELDDLLGLTTETTKDVKKPIDNLVTKPVPSKKALDDERKMKKKKRRDLGKDNDNELRKNKKRGLDSNSAANADAIRDRYLDKKANPKKKKRLTQEDLKGHRFANLLLQLDLRVRNLDRHNTQLAVKRQAALDSGDSNTVARTTQQINRNNLDKALYKSDIEFIQTNNMLSKTAYIAERDISRIKWRLDNEPNLEIEELQTMQQMLNFWRASGEFVADADEHIIFSKDDMTSDVMKDTFRRYKHQSEPLAVRVEKKLQGHFTELINQQYGGDAKYDEITALANDIGTFRKNLFHIGRTDNAILQAIYKKVKASNIRANLESTKLVDEIDEIMGEFIAWAADNNIENPFDLFKQKFRGKDTGNLVTFVSEEFNQAQKKNFWDVIFNDDATKEERKAAYAWEKENTMLLDPRKLFNKSTHVKRSKGAKVDLQTVTEERFTDEDREAHIQEIYDEYGEEMGKRLVKEAEKKIKEYETAWQGQHDNLLDEHQDDETSVDFDNALALWEKTYSPFYHATTFIDFKNINHTGTNEDYKLGKQGRQFNVIMPRKHKAKYKETGKRRRNKKKTLSLTTETTNYFDKDFDKILQSPQLLKAWTFYTDMMQELNKFTPPHKRKGMKHNTVIAVKKSVREIIMDNKTQGTPLTKMAALKLHAANLAGVSNLKNQLRTGDYSTITGNTFDPATNKKLRYVSASFVRDNKEDMQFILDRKEAIFQGENKRNPTVEEMDVMIAETLQELSDQKSFDLQHVLKSYAQQLVAYKHKAAIESQVHLAADVFKSIEERATNSKDEQLFNKYGKEQVKGPMQHYNEMLDHFMDNFDNFAIKDTEGLTDIDMFTKEEQAEIAQIEKAIENLKKLGEDGTLDEATVNESVRDLTNQLATIGGKLTKSKVFDKALQFTQLKIMGWNVPAAIMNLMFGQAQNWIEAASGRFYKAKSFNQAIKMVWSSRPSTGKFISGNANANHNKLKNIAHKMGLLQSNLDIAENHQRSWLGKKLPLATPYGIGNAAEFMNQMPVAIAVMLETMVEDGKGGEINILDAMDNQGNLKEQYRTPKNLDNWQAETTSPTANEAKVAMIAKIHEAIITIHGNYNVDAPVLAKRKWYGRAAFQFKSWLPEAIDLRFGKEHKDSVTGIVRKGRYQSIYNSKNIEGENIPILTGLRLQLKAMLPKLLVGDYENDLDMFEHDLANMRATARELQIIIGIMMMGVLFSAMHGDDDEDDSYFYNFVLNMGKRLLSDLTFVYNVSTPTELAENMFSVTQIATDVFDFGHAVLRTTLGDGTISSGINEGKWRITKEIGEMTPFLKQLSKMHTLFSKEITTPGSNIDLLQDLSEQGYGLGKE